jgi:hypothetical protein
MGVMALPCYLLFSTFNEQMKNIQKTEVLNGIHSQKKDQEIHLSKLNTQVEKFSKNPLMEKIFDEFDFSFKNSANELRKLKNFDEVAAGLKKIYEINAKDFSEYTLTFSETTRLMQYYYLDSKHTDEEKSLSSYDRVHKIYHPLIKNFQENLNLSNVYFVGIYGSVVYASHKDIVFGTNIKRDIIVKNLLPKIEQEKKGVFPCFTQNQELCYYIAADVFDDRGLKVGTIVAKQELNSLLSMPFTWTKKSENYNAVDFGNMNMGILNSIQDKGLDEEFIQNQKKLLIYVVGLFFVSWVLLYSMMYFPLRKLETENAKVLNEKMSMEAKNTELLRKVEDAKQKIDSVLFQLSETEVVRKKIQALQKKLSDAYALIENANSLNKSNQEEIDDDVSEALSKIKELKIDHLEHLSVYEDRNLKVVEMQNSLEEIQQKIRHINDLVFQTKLIAFNTSVEGTRSMESSKYFSTVATEITEISNQYAHATSELKKNHDQLKQLIENFLNDNNQALEDLTNSSKPKIEDVESALVLVKKDINILSENLNRIGILSFGSLELIKNQSTLFEELQIISEGSLDSGEKEESSGEDAA